jgi:hypothetical protein
MNNIYKTPLLTDWPIPVSFKECFEAKRTLIKNRIKKEASETIKLIYPYFFDIFSAPHASKF